MERGLEPIEACKAALRLIDQTTRQPRLRNDGKPAFNVTLYALRSDGLIDSAPMHHGYTFIAQRDTTTTLELAASLFPKS